MLPSASLANASTEPSQRDPTTGRCNPGCDRQGLPLPESAPAGYTNNLWIHQDDPYNEDMINAYNDGPNDSGGKWGGFFELETISPALPLKKDESYMHTTRIVRFEEQRDQLDQIAQTLFGAKLDRIENAFEG